jgi:hypothetical protein
MTIALTEKKREPLPFEQAEEKIDDSVSKLKTEEFFEEFDKKFIVTFDGEERTVNEEDTSSNRNPER